MHHTEKTDQIRALLAQNSGHVHLMGVCGIGMAGLAFLLKSRGFEVSGCDLSLSESLHPWLDGAGVNVQQGHAASHVHAGVDALIRSTAVQMASVEVEGAVKNSVPVFRRGEVLPILLEGHSSIAVTGTHGKTTTSALIAQVLRASGRIEGWCIGGEVPALGAVAGHLECNDGYLVVEADESDGTAALYAPDIAVVTNVEFDHMEHFSGVEDFQLCFRFFIGNTRQCVVYGADDATAVRLVRDSQNAVGFGFADGADYACSDVKIADGHSDFSIQHGREHWDLRIPFAGRHNVLNATAAFAVCHTVGIAPSEIASALAAATLPRRRLEVLGESNGIRIVSDYAHHPSEVRCALAALREGWAGRLVTVFQPHRYSRTLALGADFPAAFSGVDTLVLAPVYAASEQPQPGACEWDLYAEFRTAAAHNDRIPVPILASSLDDVWQCVTRIVRPGDMLVVLGAGDVEQIAFQARDAMAAGLDSEAREFVDSIGELSLSSGARVAVAEPMASKTTLGLGGLADVWVSVDTVDDFKRVLAWTSKRDIPFTLVGGGSNLLIGDAGIRGVVCRLEGQNFRDMRLEGEGTFVAGAAATLAEMLDWLEARALSNLEFIQGIPGTLGGGMHMNAGAWRKSLGDHVLWVRCLDAEGVEHMVERDELQLGYRHCGYLESRYVIEAAFEVTPGDPTDIRAQREVIREKRAWMEGYRSAGSAFKNPSDDHAGRLLEAAGMRGQGVGGARVYEGHGNFITASEGATPSDVRALVGKGRMAVAHAFNVDLELEWRTLR